MQTLTRKQKIKTTGIIYIFALAGLTYFGHWLFHYDTHTGTIIYSTLRIIYFILFILLLALGIIETVLVFREQNLGFAVLGSLSRLKKAGQDKFRRHTFYAYIVASLIIVAFGTMMIISLHYLITNNWPQSCQYTLTCLFEGTLAGIAFMIYAIRRSHFIRHAFL